MTASVDQSVPPTSLRSQPDFIKLWIGQGVSMLGTSVSSVALPLVAVITLRASTLQVGVLSFAQTLPALPLSLFIGVVVDRVSRRRLLIAADLGRGAVVGLVPLLAALGDLRISFMYFCMFAMGVLTMVFDITYRSYLPDLVPESLLLRANSQLELTRNVLSLSGKGIAGAAISVVRIPLVVTADAVSYFCSAVGLALIRRPEPQLPAKPMPGLGQVFREIREGIAAVFSNRYLRPQAINAAAINFLTQIVLTLFVVYATRSLHLSGGWIGLIFAAGSLGGVAGAMLVSRAIDRFGYGRAFLGFMITLRLALLFVAFVRGPTPVVIALLTVLWFFALLGLVGSNICFATLRQVAVASEVRGRTNAALNALILGALPLAALAAGVLGSAIGVHATILVASVAMPLPLLLVVFSPALRMKTVSEAAPQRAP
jgi:MFS family permease